MGGYRYGLGNDAGCGSNHFLGGNQADAEPIFTMPLTTYTAYDSYRMSLCHSWSSTPVVWIARYVLGIRALEPGYARIAFEPHAIGAHGRTGVIPSPRGLIKVEWKLEHGRMIKSARIGEAELAGRA